LVSADNPLFARAWANRVWKELLGRGLVEPVDDLRGTNPASIPDLLDALAADLVESGFDLRHLIREIARSSVYQLDSRSNAINQEDDRLFSHAYLKPLNGPVLADAITQALDVPELFEGQPRGTLAVQLIDPGIPSHTLEVFGRCPRIITCEPATERGGGLSQALHLISGPAINARLTEAAARLLAAAGSERDAVERAYLRVLSRSPTASESRNWTRMIRAGTSKQEPLEDLLWALLNSREFALNH
jgi:hypothetical protein